MINRMVKGAILATAGVISVSFIAACAGGGVAQSDFDDLEAQVTSIESALDTANRGVAGLTNLLTQLGCTGSGANIDCANSPVLGSLIGSGGDTASGGVFGNIGSPGGFLQRALNGEFRDTAQEVSVFGPCRDQCELEYNAILDQFEAATGIPANYIGSADFEIEINTLVAAGQPPDIVDFPQPGLLQGFVAEGLVENVTDHISLEWLQQQYNPGWVEASMLPGPDGEPFTAGVWSRTNAKSYVWYSPDNFEAAGYEVPETWEELLALTDQIKADGATPWCVGIESGAATGWLATDWTEDLLLRTTSLENYDRWTVPATASDRLLFDSPEVRRAIQLWGNLWFEEGNVRGGRDTIVAVDFGAEAGDHLFSDPPGCYMIRQAAFITGEWITELGLVPGEDFDAFYFPTVDEEFGRPFLISGDLNAAFSDRPEVLAVLEFHATPEYVNTFLQDGGTLSPFRSTQPEDYSTQVQAIASDILGTATSLRFDGSDLQPGAVGSGAFWNEITEYVAGNQDLDATVRAIDAAWPN